MVKRFIVLWLFLIIVAGMAQANYIIGSPETSTLTICANSGPTAPMRVASQYSQSQCCYASNYFPSTDITFTGIGWYKCTATAAYNRTIQVRLTEVSSACSLTTSTPYAAGTLVYSGTLSVTAAQGWQMITFNQTAPNDQFTLHAGYNLVVDVCDNTGSTGPTTQWALSANPGYTGRLYHFGTSTQCDVWPGSGIGVANGFAVIQLTTVDTITGENCLDPYPISCGECKVGNTAGKTNDYDCDTVNAGHDGPDVVYEFTLASTQTVRIQGEARFDADWGLASECDAGLGDFLCIDYYPTSTTNPAICGNLTAVNYSALDYSIVLQAGTYYIWVDGYTATNYGPYALQVDCTAFTPTITCPADSIFSQPARAGTDAWEASISDQGYGNLIADDFWGLTQDICDIHWWGLNAYNDGTGWTTCTRPSPDLFDIIFYDDNTGPGTAVATFTGVSVTPTLVDTYGSFNLYSYSVDLPTCVPLTEGWVTIQAQTATNCWFLWAGSYLGDNVHGENDGTGWLFYYHDMAFCLTPPDITPTPTVTETPVVVTETPTDIPTETPTDIPTETPTTVPTETPTTVPTETPTLVPTETPTLVPTETPTLVPTETPTLVPTETPTLVPTVTPTLVPTETPTLVPTVTPTLVPTVTPTLVPTETPTVVPTETPTDIPTTTPTTVPSETPAVTNTPEPTSTPFSGPVPATGPLGLGLLMAVFSLAIGLGALRKRS